MTIAIVTKHAVYVLGDDEPRPVAYVDGEPIYREDLPCIVRLLDCDPDEDGVPVEVIGYAGDEYDEVEVML